MSQHKIFKIVYDRQWHHTLSDDKSSNIVFKEYDWNYSKGQVAPVKMTYTSYNVFTLQIWLIRLLYDLIMKLWWSFLNRNIDIKVMWHLPDFHVTMYYSIVHRQPTYLIQLTRTRPTKQNEKQTDKISYWVQVSYDM